MRVVKDSINTEYKLENIFFRNFAALFRVNYEWLTGLTSYANNLFMLTITRCYNLAH